MNHFDVFVRQSSRMLISAVNINAH